MSDPITLVDDPDGTEHVLCRVAGVECRVNGTLPASLRPALDGLMAESSPGGGCSRRSRFVVIAFCWFRRG